jgi:hypothetical protein
MADQCLYSKCKNEQWICVFVYVDDLIIAHKQSDVNIKLGDLLDQYHTVDQLGSTDVKASSTPLDAAYLKMTVNKIFCLKTSSIDKQWLYTATTTRPYIAAAMSIICRFVSKPRQRD